MFLLYWNNRWDAKSIEISFFMINHLLYMFIEDLTSEFSMKKILGCLFHLGLHPQNSGCLVDNCIFFLCFGILCKFSCTRSNINDFYVVYIQYSTSPRKPCTIAAAVQQCFFQSPACQFANYCQGN